MREDSDTYIDESTELGQLTRRYLDLLLAGRRREASALILDRVHSGTPIKRIYLDVFQTCQYEVGRLWEENLITVAHEHFCTAATQMIMSQLYGFIFATERCGKTVVATCVGNDLHELGVRMVCDFFEMAGWDTYYLGANTPNEAVIASVRERRAHLLAVSATLSVDLHQMHELIRALRREPDGAAVKVLVGGAPCARDPHAWRHLGADGSAHDAEAAVELGRRLTMAGA